MPDNRPCQLSRKHYRVFGIIFSHFPSPPRRQTALPFFFRFLNAKHTASLSPSAQFFPAFPLRHTGPLFRSFFASLNAKHTASLSPSSPSAQFFPALPSPSRQQAAFSSFFRFLKCQMHRFSQPVRPIFPSLPSPPRRQAAILVKIDVPPQTDENFAFPYEKLFFSGKNRKKHF